MLFIQCILERVYMLFIQCIIEKMHTKRSLQVTNLVLLLTVLCLGPCIINICNGQVQLFNSDEFELQTATTEGTIKTGVSFPYWDTSGVEDTLVLITSAYANATGRVLYSSPIQFINLTSGTVFSFATYIRFQIFTSNGSGDGFAFANGATMGLLSKDDSNWYETDSSRNLLALEFDIYLNPEVSDPSESHIGIDINGLNSSSYYNSNDSNNDLYLFNDNTIEAWLLYAGENRTITVWAAPVNNTTIYERPSSPILSYTISNATDLFQNQMYVGLTAASGSQSITVEVKEWGFDIYDGETTYFTPSHGVKPLVIALPIVSFAIITVAILVAFVLFKRSRSSRSSAAAKAALATIIPNISRYSYRNLRKATQGFRQQNKIGEGGFSVVYKGTLTDGSVVAVKKLKEGMRIEDEFAYEVRVISKIRHKNLIELQGWCYDNNEAMLVYPFMERSSLDGYIFAGTNEALEGAKRLEVLKGVAAALEYLHEGLGERVLHRDVKAAHVMLTDKWDAKLGDFGLARLIDAVNYNTSVTMTAAGTPGYVAPEVIYTGKVSDKADVYSFGVLALEVACGRRVVDGRLPPQEMRLLDWVWLLHQSDKLMEALDPRLNIIRSEKDGKHWGSPPCGDSTTANDTGDGSITDVAQREYWRCVLHVALLCCLPYPDSRPSMRGVHQVLRDKIVLPLPSAWPSFEPPSGSLKAFTSDLLSGSTASSGKSSSSQLQLGRHSSTMSNSLD